MGMAYAAAGTCATACAAVLVDVMPRRRSISRWQRPGDMGPKAPPRFCCASLDWKPDMLSAPCLPSPSPART